MEESADSNRIVVRRRMPAPREVVYDAWIDPKGIREWMCPGDVVSAEAVLDVRVGGSFRIVMRSQDRVHEHSGTYRIVGPPAKLAFTWTEADNPTEMTLVTVEFLPHGPESELVITHERFVEAEAARRYKNGWGTIANKFATYLLDHAKRPAR